MLITSPLLNRPLISVTPAGNKLLLFLIARIAPVSKIILPDG